MKRRLAFLLSIMLLAGCTKQTANSSSTSNTSTSSTNENSGGCAAFAECESSEDEAKLYEDLLTAQNTPFEKSQWKMLFPTLRTKKVTLYS